MDDSQHALSQWLQGRTERWERLEQGLQQQRDRNIEDVAATAELIEGFRGLSRDLSLSRQVMPDGRITRYLEDLLLRSHEMVYRRPRGVWRSLTELFTVEVPQLMRELRWNVVATVGLFVTSLGVGWLLVHSFPELAPLFASQAMIDMVQSGELWTDDLLNILPSSVLALSIITNNITVTLFAFVLGTLYGLGTVYIIALNGLMLGGVVAFTAQYGLDARLLEFVVAHGVVELSVICLAGALGIELGEALIRPGTRTRTVAFQTAVSKAGKLLLAAIPFLMGAGLIEGYISPSPDYSLTFRVAVGVGFGAVFWLVLSGWMWRRSPDNSPRVRS